MTKLRLSCAVGLAFVCAIPVTDQAFAGIYADQMFGFSVTVASRWSQRGKRSGRSDWARVTYRDREKSSSFFLTAVRNKHNITEWMTKTVMPKTLKWYSEGYGYNVLRAQNKRMRTGSGHQFTARQYNVVVNGHSRHVLFAWARVHGVAYWVIFFNTGKEDRGGLEAGVQAVFSGVKLFKPQ